MMANNTTCLEASFMNKCQCSLCVCVEKKNLRDDKLRRRGCNTSTPPSSTTHICCRYMHACTIKIHLKIILCFWVQQLGLAHCCPVHSLLMIYIANCLILKINHTSYLSHNISAFDKFSSTFLLITMSFWLLGKVHRYTDKSSFVVEW